MEAIVEFHANKDNNNNYIVNEFAVVSEFSRVQLVFKAPFCKSLLNNKSLRTLRWLTRHFHKIDWRNDGLTFRKDFVNNILSQFSTVYTKGEEKAEFLNKFHPNVIELESGYTVPHDYECNYKCLLPQHDRYGNCALRNACFYFEHLKSVGSV